MIIRISAAPHPSGAKTFHIQKPFTGTGCPSSSIFFIQVHNIWMERTVKLSGSLWLAVIVGTKAVDHSYLDGFSRRCLMKLDKRAPTLSQKHLTLSGGNFSLLAPKLMRFFQKTGIWKIFLFNCTSFHEQFFYAHKTQLTRFTIAWFWQPFPVI